MRILHYFLGFPPYRSGGLTKFATDLMCSQIDLGHQVFALWPGTMIFFHSNISLKKNKPYCNIENYEIINPLPVPLDEGIRDFNSYTKSCDKNVFRSFFQNHKIDVIHVHTLMGLYQEFVIVAKELGIPLIFTTHDYFGICPKVTLFRQNKPCFDPKCVNCFDCNKNALSVKKIKIIQSSLYRKLKDFKFVALFRKRHRNSFFQENLNISSEEKKNKIYAIQYRDLRAFYIDMLKQFDFIHFNSSVTESIYQRYFTPRCSKIISITHRNIGDNRTCALNKKESCILRMTYLGPLNSLKGFYLLRDVLDELWKDGLKSFSLKIFHHMENRPPYIQEQKEGYRYSDLKEIFSETDLLLAPSLWYETFGYTVLEALSYGVPVIVSDDVGAKDIVGNSGIIVKAGDKESLKNAISSLSNDKIDELRKNIQEHASIKTWCEFSAEMMQTYNQIIKNNTRIS